MAFLHTHAIPPSGCSHLVHLTVSPTLHIVVFIHVRSLRILIMKPNFFRRKLLPMSGVFVDKALFVLHLFPFKWQWHLQFLFPLRILPHISRFSAVVVSAVTSISCRIKYWDKMSWFYCLTRQSYQCFTLMSKPRRWSCLGSFKSNLL